MTGYKMKILMAGVALCGVAFSASAQQNPDEVEITVEHLRGGIYALFGPGAGNIGISIGEDGVFMIDDQFAPRSEKIATAITELSDKPIRFLLNTHYHGDHAGGNENFGKAGALIIAHDNVRTRLVAQDNPATPAIALPVMTYSDQVSLYINGERALAVHVSNAHTDGDTIIHFMDSNVIHMGDTFFHDWYPFIDVQGGGNVDGVIMAAEKVLEHSNDETIIIPGHGPIATPDDLRRYRDMLVDTRGKIAALIEDGMSEDDVVAAGPTSDYDADWNWPFINGERYTRSVYQSLKK